MPADAKGRILDRLARRITHYVYTSWGRLGGLSATLAERIEFAGPPVLVLSLPRSGSSWLGAVLGNAENTLYLREPVSERLRAADEPYTLVDVDPRHPTKVVEAASDRAFAGIPSFPLGVIRESRRWSLYRRRRSHLVIKEVNPLACAFWLQRYQPLVIFLVRHPAAVALSYRRLGWLENPDVQMDLNDPNKTIWEKNGLRQGYIHRTVLHCLQKYPHYRIVRYEELCYEPVASFQSLFAFAGLPWEDRARQLVEARSAGGDRGSNYDTHRDSRSMTDSWRGKLQESELEDLRRGYQHFDLPWYNDPQDWQDQVDTRPSG